MGFLQKSRQKSAVSCGRNDVVALAAVIAVFAFSTPAGAEAAGGYKGFLPAPAEKQAPQEAAPVYDGFLPPTGGPANTAPKNYTAAPLRQVEPRVTDQIQLKLKALGHVAREDYKDRKTEMPDYAQSVLSKPQKKINGMYPLELGIAGSIQDAFSEINAAPSPGQRRDLARRHEKKLMGIIDLLDFKESLPVEQRLKMGYSEIYLEQEKVAIQNSRERLAQALKAIREY